jgi:hypothetical protein
MGDGQFMVLKATQLAQVIRKYQYVKQILVKTKL